MDTLQKNFLKDATKALKSTADLSDDGKENSPNATFGIFIVAEIDQLPARWQQEAKNNIQNFIGIKQFAKGRWFSIKDLTIINNQIYISFSEEIREDCWNTSILRADMNFEEIKFRRLYKK